MFGIGTLQARRHFFLVYFKNYLCRVFPFLSSTGSHNSALRLAPCIKMWSAQPFKTTVIFIVSKKHSSELWTSLPTRFSHRHRVRVETTKTNCWQQVQVPSRIRKLSNSVRKWRRRWWLRIWPSNSQQLNELETGTEIKNERVFVFCAKSAKSEVGVKLQKRQLRAPFSFALATRCVAGA